MNILGIDYGSKNIGLAWVQTGLAVVLPYGIIKDKNLAELAELIKKEKIDKVVVGLPFGLEKKENENTKKIRKFADDLKDTIGIPIEFEDERFSSQAADRMGGGGASRDEKAAMIILQSYIARNK